MNLLAMFILQLILGVSTAPSEIYFVVVQGLTVCYFAVHALKFYGIDWSSWDYAKNVFLLPIIAVLPHIIDALK